LTLWEHKDECREESERDRVMIYMIARDRTAIFKQSKISKIPLKIGTDGLRYAR